MKTYRMGFNPNYSDNNPTLEHINNIHGSAFLEFGAPWCGHCLAAAPIIEEALTTQTVPHIKVHDGKGLPLGRAFKVKRWPTLILLHDGEEVARVVRPTSIDHINELLADIKI